MLPLSGTFFPAFYLPASLSLLLQRRFLQEAFLYALGWLRHFLWARTFPFVFPMVALTLRPALPPSMPWSLQHPPDHAELSLSGECLSPPFFRELVRTGTEATWLPLCSQHRAPQGWAWEKFSMCIRPLMLSSGLITYLVLNKSEKEIRRPFDCPTLVLSSLLHHLTPRPSLPWLLSLPLPPFLSSPPATLHTGPTQLWGFPFLGVMSTSHTPTREFQALPCSADPKEHLRFQPFFITLAPKLQVSERC